MRNAVLALVLFASCGGGAHAPGAPIVGPAIEDPLPSGDPARLAFAHRIDDEETWHRLAARPENQVVARTEVVKFLIDLTDDRRLWLIDTERWSIHFYFARQFLASAGHPIEDHAQFNVLEYRRPERRFEMGSLVHYLDSDLWTLELVAGDKLEGERVLRVLDQLRGSVFFGDRLRYRPISPLHEQQIAPVADRIPIVSTDEVFAGIRYQPLTEGVAFGTLRFVRGPLDPASVRPDQILVLEELPDEIPVAAAVSSAPMQAPLGHLAILCATRRTPNMALRDALSDPALSALDGHLVRLEVGPQEHSIREATRAEAEAAWADRRPAQPLVPHLDTSETALRDACSLRLEDARTVGAKAAQLGELCSIGPPIHTPGGFAIPFAHYVQHLERSGVAASLPAMLADPAFRSDATARARQLAELRAVITQARVDPQVVRAIRDRIASFPGHPRVIFRSSTNAEDLPGFTGAGLYESIVVPGNASEAQIADALREVWASVWRQVAFEERDWYRIDHARVAMGVLVQPFVDGAAVNGVAITANPFFQGRPGLFVNAQALGGSVTGAHGDEVPEQHLIYTYSETIESELLSRSSRTDGMLLSEQDIGALADALQRVHQHFLWRWQQTWVAEHPDPRERDRGPDQASTAVDVEFLVAGPDRRIVLLQARPYHLVYGPGQGWVLAQ